MKIDCTHPQDIEWNYGLCQDRSVVRLGAEVSLHLKAFGRLRIWPPIHSVVWACIQLINYVCSVRCFYSINDLPNCDSFFPKPSRLQTLGSKGLPVKAGMFFLVVYSCTVLFMEHFAVETEMGCLRQTRDVVDTCYFQLRTWQRIVYVTVTRDRCDFFFQHRSLTAASLA